MSTQHEWEALHVRGTCYAVRPKGQLGTCGWHPFPWKVIYVEAGSEKLALMHTQHERAEQEKRKAVTP